MSIWALSLFLLVEALLIGLVFMVAFYVYQGYKTVPWIKTTKRISQAMLELGDLKPGETVLDLGSGDGSIALKAVSNFGAKAIGIERLWLLVFFSKFKARLRGVQNQTEFIQGDIFTHKLPKADLITAYLFPKVNLSLEPVLLSRFPSKTKVVSRDFLFPGFTHIKTISCKNAKLHLYELP